jgi:hypothetical protein
MQGFWSRLGDDVIEPEALRRRSERDEVRREQW